MHSRWKHVPRLALALLLGATLAVVSQYAGTRATLLAAPAAVENPTTTIFINEFHYDDEGSDEGEFIEVAGPAGSDLTGWTLVLYNGSNSAVYDTDPLPTTIPATGCPYGVVTVSYAGTLQNGAPDGIALVDNSGALVQFLSYEGTLTGSGGAANGQLSTDVGVAELGSDPPGNSLQLSGSGTTYGDFTWGGPSTASPGEINAGQSFGACADAPPTVSSVTPADGSTGIALDTNLTVSFDEPVTVTDPWFSITCATSGAHPATVDTGPQNFVIDPQTDFANGELCTVTLTAAQIVDQDGEANPLAADFTWSFTTVADLCSASSYTLIHAIQGSSGTSPEVGNTVTVKGVVVGDYQGGTALSGFYLQEEDADADSDPATSEGLFVFSNVEVNAGDVVAVQGQVVEFGDPGVTMTEIGSGSQLQVCTTGASVTPATVNMPVSSLADWESLEGMLVTIPEVLTVSENFTLGRFGEVVLSAEGRLLQPTHVAAPGAPALAVQAANDLNRIVLDDARTVQNPEPIIHPAPFLSADNTLRTGDTVENLTGILDQRFALYRIQPVGTPNFVAANPRPAAPDPVGGRITVAAANVLNYFTTLDESGNLCGPPTFEQECRGANSAVEFARQRAKIVNGLGTLNADVVGLIEIENNPSAAVADLVAGLNTLLGADTYAFIDTGYIGTDAIKVALIYKPGSVTPIGNFAILNSIVDPDFIDTLNRPVLAQTFAETATGERFTVAVNHLKSKGSDCNAVGDPDLGDGQGNCNATRTAAANALAEWLASDPTSSGDPDFLIIGDLNSYAMEDPITALKNAGYTDLLNFFHGEDAYSYVFQGQTGYLDHALASASLLGQVTGATEWHANADEPVVMDYNVEFKPAPQVEYLYTEQPYRFSDHDPLVVGLDLATDSSATITIVKDANPDNRRNFRFHGDLGFFRLDDATDGDLVGNSRTFEVNAGTYTVIEDVPYWWHLTNIVCADSDATVDLGQRSVAITVAAGQDAMCTFTNAHGSAVWIDKYFDRNANGTRFWEVGLPGWTFNLYDSEGTAVATGTTNIFGKVRFWNVAPGAYTVCETLQPGWFNSQPGTIDPTYGQPCYAVNIGPAQLVQVQFGNHNNPGAVVNSVGTPAAVNMSALNLEQMDDESYEDAGPFIDPSLNEPAQGEAAPLFLPSITR